MPVKPVTRDAITAALKECGPMSVIELVDHLGWGRNRINACMTTARANHPGKFFRIVRYQLQVGVRGRETPVYAAGRGRDAPRPAFDQEHAPCGPAQTPRRCAACQLANRADPNGAAKPITHHHPTHIPHPAGFFKTTQ